MTFEEWQRSRSPLITFSEEDAGVYGGQQGYSYDAGFLLCIGDGYMVPLPQEEREFTALADAERCLWDEWCKGEINGEEQ